MPFGRVIRQLTYLSAGLTLIRPNPVFSWIGNRPLVSRSEGHVAVLQVMENIMVLLNSPW